MGGGSGVFVFSGKNISRNAPALQPLPPPVGRGGQAGLHRVDQDRARMFPCSGAGLVSGQRIAFSSLSGR